MFTDLQSNASAKALRIGLAVSRYHGEITQSMQKAAEEAFLRAGGVRTNLQIVTAPGSFELVAVCRALAMMSDARSEPSLDAVIALGCVITGQTTHDQYIANAVANGLAHITVECGTPVCFGVLTCQTIDQARARAGLDLPEAGKSSSNKGAETMVAAIEVANTVRALERDGQGRA